MTKNEFRVSDETRRKHVYIQGATGTGKTTLIVNMALQDIGRNRGISVLDFTGDLSHEILSRIPERRLKDVVYVNPGDLDFPVGINLLSYDTKCIHRDLHKERIVDAILSWLKREYSQETIGPVFFQNVRNGLLLTMDDENPATIIDFMNIFLDREFFDNKLKSVKNPFLRRYWERVYDRKKYNMTTDGLTLLQYILCKFSPLVDSSMTRNIFGQRSSKIDFQEIVRSNKILLCNFSKGIIGSFNSSFFGLMLLMKIEQAALSLVNTPEEKRQDHYLYLDECQNVQTEHFYNLLSEMRKYRLNITLANQHFSQLDKKMEDSILSNCGTMVIFKTGVKDAQLMEPILYPCNQRLLTGLENFRAAIRTTGSGPAKTSLIKTLPLRFSESPLRFSRAVTLSRQKYAKSREEVEKNILSAW